jgi:hypothetical protein
MSRVARPARQANWIRILGKKCREEFAPRQQVPQAGGQGQTHSCHGLCFSERSNNVRISPFWEDVPRKRNCRIFLLHPSAWVESCFSPSRRIASYRDIRCGCISPPGPPPPGPCPRTVPEFSGDSIFGTRNFAGALTDRYACLDRCDSFPKIP